MPELFRITYVDPETEEEKIAIKEFTDSANVTAEEWAEDWAYMAADKGPYEIQKAGKKI